MERRKVYWTIGIIVAAIFALIWIFGSKNTAIQKGGIANQESQDETGTVADNITDTAQDGQTEMNHAAMEEGNYGTASDEDTAVTKYLREQNSIMTAMMEKMHMVEKTASADIAFLKGMLPHHDSAIEMANSYLRHGGENESLKKIAENIVKVQEEEVEQMQAMIKDIEEGGSRDADKEEAYLEEYQRMMAQHHSMSSTAAESVEKAFAEGMIVHHQMAIDMAESILNYAEDEEVKTLAQAIIDAQQEEISQMQEIIKTL